MTTKALLVEDNERNRYLVTFLLERHGFTVVHAATGLRAIDLADRETFDIILLDIQLPEMDGYAVARRLRQMPSLHAVPIVAVTSYAMAGDREKALEAGCNGYIEKPINPDTFVTDVRRHLRPREEGGAA